MRFVSSAAVWFGRLTSLLPARYNQTLWRALRLAKRQPIFRITGRSHSGEHCAMIVAGLGPASDYLPSLFFSGEQNQELIETVSIWKLPRRLRELRATAELTVARVDVLLARWLFGPEYLRVPEWVRSSMPVPSTVDTLGKLSGSLRQDLRLVRKNQFKPVESRDEVQLQEFYETMFRPHTVGRHRATTYLKSFKELKGLWQCGCLIWVELASERVAGMVVSIKKDRLLFAALGTRDGDETILRKGALSAAYLFSIEYARRHGCQTIDFGATRPSLNDGLLRYKRKWGAVLDPKPTNPVSLLTFWPSASASVLAMLDASPLIFRQQKAVCCIYGNINNTPAPEAINNLDFLYVAGLGQPLIPLTLAPKGKGGRPVAEESR